MNITDFIGHWWPVAAASGALILATVIMVKYKIPNILMRIMKLEKDTHKQEITKDDLSVMVRKKELYEEDGRTPLYQPRSGCKEMQELCQGRICKKIDEIKNTVTGEFTVFKKDLATVETERKKDRLELVALQKDVVRVTTQVVDMFELRQTQDLKDAVALTDASIKKIIQHTITEMKT